MSVKELHACRNGIIIMMQVNRVHRWLGLEQLFMKNIVFVALIIKTRSLNQLTHILILALLRRFTTQTIYFQIQEPLVVHSLVKFETSQLAQVLFQLHTTHSSLWPTQAPKAQALWKLFRTLLQDMHPTTFASGAQMVHRILREPSLSNKKWNVRKLFQLQALCPR